MKQTNQDAKITAEAIGLIMRQNAIVTERGFAELWDEVACGHETYGPRNLVWTTFVREHNTDYWYKRILNAILRRRKERTL